MKVIISSDRGAFPIDLRAKYLQSKGIPFFVYIYDFMESNYKREENWSIDEIDEGDLLALKDLGPTVSNYKLYEYEDSVFNPNFVDENYRFDEDLIRIVEETKDYCIFSVHEVGPGIRFVIKVTESHDDDYAYEEIVLEHEMDWITA